MTVSSSNVKGRGVSPATPCGVPTKPHAVCVPCLRDEPVSSELIAKTA
jgi:hypothetical protein